MVSQTHAEKMDDASVPSLVLESSPGLRYIGCAEAMTSTEVSLWHRSQWSSQDSEKVWPEHPTN